MNGYISAAVDETQLMSEEGWNSANDRIWFAVSRRVEIRTGFIQIGRRVTELN